jgi:hypothetical protein
VPARRALPRRTAGFVADTLAGGHRCGLVRIRVVQAQGTAADASDASLTVAPAFITVPGPAAGASWGYGTIQKQVWQTNLGPLDGIDVRLSTDGGATFPTLVRAQCVIV